MTESSRRAPHRPWLRHAVPAAIAVACCAFIVLSQANLAIAMIVVIAGFGLASLWITARELRLHAAINRYSALGQPQPILDLVAVELAYSKTPRIRVPFTIYRAMALGLSGEWQAALDVLDDVDLPSMRGKARRTWYFLYHSHRFTCLLFCGRVDEAEKIFDDAIAPYAATVPSLGTAIIARESRAKLAFFQNRLDEARTEFSALLEDDRIAPASRAVYHYFLGRVDRMRRTSDPAGRASGGDPTGHFAEAVALAPETFITRDVAALTSDA